jgi:hypothetical protein
MITKQKLNEWREQHRTGKPYSTKSPEFKKAVQADSAKRDEPWTREYFLIRPVRVSTPARETLPPEVASLFDKQRDKYGSPGVWAKLYELYGVDFHHDKEMQRVEFVGASTLRGSFQTVHMRLAQSGRLRDKTEEGQAVLILDRKPEPLSGCIAVMLRIALAKGWVEIEGEGTGEFLMSLWPQAESLGIAIRARAEQQEAWGQYQVMKQKQKLADYKAHNALYPEEEAQIEAEILKAQVQTRTAGEGLPARKQKL